MSEPEKTQQTGIATNMQIAASRGMADWLATNDTSLAVSSYQTGQLFLIGRLPNGALSLHQQNFDRAMGVWADTQRIYVATAFELSRLENVLRPGQVANEHYDRMFVPRNTQATGDLDIHELGVEPNGRVVFVNTLYSCLACFDVTHGFKPIWQPPFISKLAPEDRCHLNGLAMEDGKARYVTAVSATDSVDGWRDRRADGGMIIDLANDDKILTQGLSMPHSPRVHNGQLYVEDSGRGYLCRVDRDTGAFEDIAFLPGFLRGLSFVGHYAIATLSEPRDGSFAGLALDDEMAKRDADPWCGVQIVDLNNGDVVQWIRLKGPIRELFSVAALPGVVAPYAVAYGSNDHKNYRTFSE
jgi:uncharacterized protein (TIGR03032 family)